jgi:hypothetical protein
MRIPAAFVLLAACSCGPLFGVPSGATKAERDAAVAQANEWRQKAGQAARDAAPFLPTPFNYLAEGVGLLVTYAGGHKVIRHRRKKKRAARRAQAAGAPGSKT